MQSDSSFCVYEPSNIPFSTLIKKKKYIFKRKNKIYENEYIIEGKEK